MKKGVLCGEILCRRVRNAAPGKLWRSTCDKHDRLDCPRELRKRVRELERAVSQLDVLGVEAQAAVFRLARLANDEVKALRGEMRINET